MRSLLPLIALILLMISCNDFKIGVIPKEDQTDVKIIPGKHAYVKIGSDGTVEASGDPDYGGDSSGINFSGGVKEIVSNGYSFAALKNDGLVITWGISSRGGDSAGVNLVGVKKVYAYKGGMYFLAVKNNGTIEFWGQFPLNPT